MKKYSIKNNLVKQSIIKDKLLNICIFLFLLSTSYAMPSMFGLFILSIFIV